MSIRDDLKAYLDGELEPHRAEEIRLALEQDPSLRAEAEFYQQLATEIRSLATEPEVVGMNRVLERFQERRPWWQTPGLRTAFALGATAFVVAAFLTLISGGFQRSASSEVAMSRSSSDVMSSEETAQPTFGSGDDASAGSSKKEVASSDGSGTAPAASDLDEFEEGATLPNRPAAASAMPDGQGVEESKRKVIVTAEVTAQARNLSNALSAATQLAHKQGGSISEFAGPQLSGQRAQDLMISVPVELFHETLAEIRKLRSVTKVLSEWVAEKDIGSLYGDTNQRLRNSERTRSEPETFPAWRDQQEYLDTRAARATIILRLRQNPR